MEDAGIVAGLVGGDAFFLFEDGDAASGIALGEAIGRRQPDDPAADHHEIEHASSVVAKPASRRVDPFAKGERRRQQQ